MQAVSIAASAMPTTGKSNSSRAPPRPDRRRRRRWRVDFAASLRQHLQHGDGADSGLGAGGDVRTPCEAVMGRSSVPGLANQLCPRRPAGR